MARLTRQELKKDEFATHLAGFQEFFLQNQKTITTAALIAVLAAVVAFGGYYFFNKRQTQASYAFGQALDTFHAMVTPVLPPQVPPTTLHFATSEEKYQQAYKQFSEVASRYSWLSQGKFARYYTALCERDLGKLSDAEKDLNAVSSSGDRDLAALAKMALAGIYQQTGRNDQAEKIYHDLENHPTNTVPKATVELALADLYQKTKPAEATALYKKIQTENPGSAAAVEAAKLQQGQ